MFLDDPKTRKALTKWAVGTVAACILIFLGVRYVSAIAIAVRWLYDLVKPLLTGTILAMILNVPLAFIERHLFRKNPTPKKEKVRRPLAILLALVLVIGVFVGIAVLVIPELTGAVSIVISSVTGALDQMVVLESSENFAQLPFAPYLEKLDIDWLTMKTQLENWMQQLSSTVLGSTASALGSAASSLIDGLVAFVFCIYVLANKETLARQIGRLARAWLPARLTNTMSHIFDVCADVFQQFIVG